MSWKWYSISTLLVVVLVAGLGEVLAEEEGKASEPGAEASSSNATTESPTQKDRPPLFDFASQAQPASDAKALQKKWAEALGVEATMIAPPGIKLTLVPPGEFMMGETDEKAFFDILKALNGWRGNPDEGYKPEPPHRVRISRPFWIGTHEVTVGQFRQFVNETEYKSEDEIRGEGTRLVLLNGIYLPKKSPKGSWQSPGFRQLPQHPVVSVSWVDANRFIDWLNEKHGGGWSLPTEAQWEYACKAGTTSTFYLGSDPSVIGRDFNSFGTVEENNEFWTRTPQRRMSKRTDGFEFTAPVGKFKPNAFGVFDMLGNVSEWVSDGFADYDLTQQISIDPHVPPNDSSMYIQRGGSFYFSSIFDRSAARQQWPKSRALPWTGFRVVREVKFPNERGVPASE